jgi:hypothetical protein
LYQFYVKANASSPMPEETFVTKAFASLPGSGLGIRDGYEQPMLNPARF